MILRKSTPQYLKNITPLQRVQARIAHHNALQLCILDATDDDGVLVVLCNEVAMEKFVKISLQRHWPGKIETYCPTALMTGSKTSQNFELEELESSVRKSSYLN